MELTPEHVGPFIPRFAEIDQKKDTRLTSFAKILADTVSVHGAATALMQLEPWDLMAVYYDGIDHFAHGFMKYHPPRQEFVSEEDFEMYKDVIAGGYRFHDMMLGAMLALVDDDTTVIVLSDHGFHPDHLRLAQLPSEPAGPAQEHREFGILVARGPGIRRGAEVHGASVLDLTPTVLSIFGLPVGMDMDGKPLVTIFETPPTVSSIPSWEEVEGPFPHGMHAAGAELDGIQSAEAIKQLVDLGYIEEPDEDSNVARRQARRSSTTWHNLPGRWPGRIGTIFERSGTTIHANTGSVSSTSDVSPSPVRSTNGDSRSSHEGQHRQRGGVGGRGLDRLRPEAEKYGIDLPGPTRLRANDGKGDAKDDENDEEGCRSQAATQEADPYDSTGARSPPATASAGRLARGPSGVHARRSRASRSVPARGARARRRSTTCRSSSSSRYCRLLDRIEDATRLTERALRIDDENADVQLELAEIAMVRVTWSTRSITRSSPPSFDSRIHGPT